MPNQAKPTSHINWVADDGANSLAPIPPSISANGFQPGQPLIAQYLNFALHNLDAWAQYLDQNVNATVLATSLNHSMRLFGGGTFSFDVSTRTLAWSAALTFATPSSADSANVLPAGSVMLNPGDVAFVNAHLPFSTTGDTTAGSTTVAHLGYETGIAVGMQVSGAGIASGTTVASVGDTSCTLSQPATATNAQTTLTFVATGALQISTMASATLIPGPTTVILARALDAVCSIGIGSTEFWLRDKERRSLVSAGYVTTVVAPAGEALSALQPVYLSVGAADGRTSGSIYRADASAANGALRAQCLGFTHTATANNASAHIVQSGILAGFASLQPGAFYYLDPSAVGGITPSQTTTVGAYVMPVGVALNATTLLVQLGTPRAFSRNGSLSVVDMGSLWSSKYSTPEVFKKTVYNLAPNANPLIGVVDRYWPATHAGSVLGISGRLFISLADANITLYIYKNNNSANFITYPLSYTPNTWVTLDVTFADGVYPFAANDVLYCVITNNTTQPNIQADISITAKLFS